MPLYEYDCSVCGERFEVLQRVGESAELVRCPGCGEGRIERRLSTFAAATGAGRGSAAEAPGACGRPQCGAGDGLTCGS